MATTNQLVTKAKLILSRQNDTLIDATIINELGLAQERLEREAWLPQFLFNALTASAPVTTETVNLTTIFPRFIRVYNRSGGLRYVDPNQEETIKLTRYDDFDQMIQLFPGSAAAGTLPSGYHMQDTLAYLRPKPTVNAPVTLVAFFYQAEASLPAAGNTNLWTQKASDYLLGEAGMVIAEALRDDTAYGQFQKMRGEDKARLLKQDVAKDEDDLDRSMGDD